MGKMYAHMMTGRFRTILVSGLNSQIVQWKKINAL
jgi:hypothetical protein